MTTSSGPCDLILDTCILVDYLKAETGILRMYSRGVGALRASSLTLEELVTEQAEAVRRVGVIVVDPHSDDLDSAIARATSGPLSVTDWVCLSTAKRHGWVLVTNDRRLRNTSEAESVALMWGFGLLENLAAAGVLDPKHAIGVAERITRMNPRISQIVLEQLRAKLGA